MSTAMGKIDGYWEASLKLTGREGSVCGDLEGWDVGLGGRALRGKGCMYTDSWFTSCIAETNTVK